MRCWGIILDWREWGWGMIRFEVYDVGRLQNFRLHGDFPLTREEAGNIEDVKQKNVSGSTSKYNVLGFMRSLVAASCGFLAVNYSSLSDFLGGSFLVNFLVFIGVFSFLFFLLGLLPIFKGNRKRVVQGKKMEEYFNFKSQKNESLASDTFFREAFPDLIRTIKFGRYEYDKVQHFDKKALEQRVDLLLNSKTYGKQFSLLIKEVMLTKETMPKKDREELEKKAGKTVKRLYDLIVSNKMDNLETGSLASLETQLLGFEELLEKGMGGGD